MRETDEVTARIHLFCLVIELISGEIQQMVVIVLLLSEDSEPLF